MGNAIDVQCEVSKAVVEGKNGGKERSRKEYWSREGESRKRMKVHFDCDKH